MNFKKVSFLLFFALFSTFAAWAAGGDDILGTWLVGDKDAQIEIYNCGDNTYCGKIVWLESPNDDNGNPRKDVNNTDASLADRPIMGIMLMKDFVFDGKEYWENGEVYNSRDGKTYAGYIKLNDDGTLYMKGGYKVFGMTVGKSDTWTRVE